MKIIELSVNRRVTVSMFALAVILFGLVSQSRLKMNLLPDLNYPTVTIRTEYENAAPAEIENLVTKPIEEALGVVKNVKQVRSVSRSNQSDVTLEFAWGTNSETASMEVREKLDAVSLPLEAKRPILLRFDPSMDPIMRFALAKKVKKDSANQALFSFASATQELDEIQELKQLRRIADEIIKKELESSNGVASVKVSGGFEEQVQVLIDEQKLAALGISIQDVIQVLSRENINSSGGKLVQGSQQLLVRTLNEFKSIDDMQQLVVSQRGDKPVYLRDIAIVEQSFKEREAITRLNGMEAVEVAIYKEGDANTIETAQSVERRLERLKKEIPASSELVKIYDQSQFISSAVDEVISAGIIGGLLAIVVLYIFLRDFWSTIIISISIPVSVIATFNLMYGNDISMNIMSLGGMALGIGLLVDNSIVVLESISKYKEKGFSSRLAALKGSSDVGTAVIASTLTTIAVFFPLVFVEGIAGQLFKDQALTVTFSLLASLFVALTLIPMLASTQRTTSVKKESERRTPKTKVGRIAQNIRVFIFIKIPLGFVWVIKKLISWISKAILWILNPVLNTFERFYIAVENSYPKLIYKALDHKFLVIAVAVMLFVGSLFMVPKLGVELIPPLSQGEFTIEFKFPVGTPIQHTDEAIKRVQAGAKGIDLIKSTFAVSGSGNRMDASTTEGGENWGEVSVVLQSGSNKSDEEKAMQALRTELQSIPGLQYKFSRPALFSFSTPVEIHVTGYNLSDLKKVSSQLSLALSKSSRFTDVKSSMEIGQPEIQVVFDRDKMATLGLSTSEVANDIVSKIRGDVATKYSLRDRKIDILVRAREDDRQSIDEINQMIVNPKSQKPVTLASVASLTQINGPGEILRVGQQRTAIITSNLAFGDLGTAAAEITSYMNTLALPSGIGVSLQGQNDEMDASFQSLLFALSLAVFLVYLVMASQFESLIHPFVILFTIPLAFIGSVWALYITGSTISVVVFIGLILLAGIVVNNAIVLIDCINQFRREGMEKYEAVAMAGKTRLRPILITTLTTVLGLLPLSMGFGDGAEIRAPMGITVIGGLSVSTMLTLIVIPVMYVLLDRKDFQSEAEQLELD